MHLGTREANFAGYQWTWAHSEPVLLQESVKVTLQASSSPTIEDFGQILKLRAEMFSEKRKKLVRKFFCFGIIETPGKTQGLT